MTQTAADLILRQSINLSFNDIQKALPDAPDYLIKDLFNKQSNINDLAQVSGSVEDQVILNTQNISTNSDEISANAQNLTNHIDDLTDAHDASAISFDNSGGLAATDVQGAIDEVDGDLTDHVLTDSAHGTTGDIVGTGNFATSLLGGVVLLAGNVVDASVTSISISTADVGAAPVAYDQAYADEQTNLINECKSVINTLVTDVTNIKNQLNAFLLANQTAKQMAP